MPARPATATGRCARPLGVLVDDTDARRVRIAHSIEERVGGARPVQLLPVRPVDGLVGDPYRLASHLDGVDVSAAILVAPRHRGVRGLFRTPVIAGVPVGVMQTLVADGADRDVRSPAPAAVDPAAGEAPWIVAAMAKNVFLDATDSWAQRLTSAGCPTLDLRADRARRSDLVDAMGRGPGVVLYAGHGSPRGWAGYQALRREHIETRPVDAPPIGVTIAFACKTLARHRNRWPFGSRLVETGVTRAYLAPAQSVFTADVEVLADIVVELLADGSCPTVADLMVAIDAAAEGVPGAARAWRTFRLVGDPLTPIGASVATSV